MVSQLSGPGLSVLTGGPLERDDMLALDRLAAAAWPATVTENLDGWSLRFADGVSRRANSVAPWPLEDGARPMEQMLHTAQTFYEEHGLPPRFQISPVAEPDALDDILTANGYEIEAPVTMHIAEAAALAADGAPDTRVAVRTEATDDWWAGYQQGFGRDVRAIVENAAETPLFAEATSADGTTAAIGLGVIGGGWLGIFAMWTRPDLRGGGLGSGILRSLCAEGLARGAEGVYLQVENHNSGAKRLYGRLGFRAAYGYYYRTLWP